MFNTGWDEIEADIHEKVTIGHIMDGLNGSLDWEPFLGAYQTFRKNNAPKNIDELEDLLLENERLRKQQ